MKKNSNSWFSQINSRQIEALTHIVEETLATGFTQPKPRIFTAAELWNIQRQAKRRVQRRMEF